MVQYLIPDYTPSLIDERSRQSTNWLQTGRWAQICVNAGWDTNIHFCIQQIFATG